ARRRGPRGSVDASVEQRYVNSPSWLWLRVCRKRPFHGVDSPEPSGCGKRKSSRHLHALRSPVRRVGEQNIQLASTLDLGLVSIGRIAVFHRILGDGQTGDRESSLL